MKIGLQLFAHNIVCMVLPELTSFNILFGTEQLFVYVIVIAGLTNDILRGIVLYRVSLIDFLCDKNHDQT